MFLLLVSVGEARIIIVAADGTGEFTSLTQAADSALYGDTVLVRDGGYDGTGMSVDSGVAVMAEHPGQVGINESPPGIVIHGTAKLMGLIFSCNPIALHTELVTIEGGPAMIFNCGFYSSPHSLQGTQLAFHSNGRPPLVQACDFLTPAYIPWISNYDSTNIWMPGNHYGTNDTTAIHNEGIWDGFHSPELGYVFISPVADSFQWLGVEDRPSVTTTVASLLAYPNPSYGTITMQLPGQHHPQQIALYNLLGQRVWSQDWNTVGASMTVSPTGLPVGNYFLNVMEPGKNYTTRITIIH
jgi:hypothetical protein